jgi:hypothetical protein
MAELAERWGHAPVAFKHSQCSAADDWLRYHWLGLAHQRGGLRMGDFFSASSWARAQGALCSSWAWLCELCPTA